MSDYWAAYPALQNDLNDMRAVLLDAIANRNRFLDEGLREIFAAPGKMLRPAFLILASRFGDPSPGKIARMAAAVEMLHVATLIHDDILDDAGTRRGRPSAHARFGRKEAVLMGDFLFARGFQLVSEYATVENARNISRAVSWICMSEIDQDTGLFRIDRSVRGYLNRIMGKTAILFVLSFHLGARESDCPPGVVSLLRRAGYGIGMGFQIVDDILDLTGSETELGKPVGSDLAVGIFTLPVILALRKDDGVLEARLAERPASGKAVREIIRLVEERGGIRDAAKYAETYTRRAMREIGKLPEGEAKRQLTAVAERLTFRRA